MVGKSTWISKFYVCPPIISLHRTESKTTRSSLLAYVSFSSADDLVLGFARKGGRLRPHSGMCQFILGIYICKLIISFVR